MFQHNGRNITLGNSVFSLRANVFIAAMALLAASAATNAEDRATSLFQTDADIGW